ncbi:hypothetical protein [Vibrio phage vB_VmeM-Yong XC32]|nr:hypothetical protein [Vibrio phage vB_VmeM-Yong XC31]QAX96344.1 hypothetical protein [Vibrio phage vB_VmeM-Yong XC32]QAX96662.1 hypothetical protein [Vibrio phage vB_VmeM-Yong MS31]QAX96980.1 hypothetical protein [Vibrio phage vB_VmeM-Yong MS32]
MTGKTQQATWDDVHVQSNLCLVGIQGCHSLMEKLTPLPLSAESKSILADCSTQLLSLCEERERIMSRGVKAANAHVSPDDFMKLYNKYGEIAACNRGIDSIRVKLSNIV